MSAHKVAQRYATSLLEVAVEKNKAEKVLGNVKLILNTIRDSRELRSFLKSPIVKTDKKLAVLSELFGKKIEPITSSFLGIVANKGREDLLGAILNAYVERYNIHAGIVGIEVTSAQELTDKQVKSLTKKLAKYTRKTVELTLVTDKALRGGLTIRIDDTVIDGSVKRKLEQLESLLLDSAQ